MHCIVFDRLTHGDKGDDRVCGGRLSLDWDGCGWSIYHHMTWKKSIKIES